MMHVDVIYILRPYSCTPEFANVEGGLRPDEYEFDFDEVWLPNEL